MNTTHNMATEPDANIAQENGYNIYYVNLVYLPFKESLMNKSIWQNRQIVSHNHSFVHYITEDSHDSYVCSHNE